MKVIKYSITDNFPSHVRGSLLVVLSNIQLLAGSKDNRFFFNYDYNLSKSILFFGFKNAWKIRNLSGII